MKLTMNSQEVISALRDLGEDRQAPFIMARGLNLLAKEVQASLRDNLSAHLNLRRVTWVRQQVTIRPGQWATKKRLVVRIETSDMAQFLASFEQGADHVPGFGRKFLAVPNPKVFNDKIITQRNPLSLANLHLRQDGNRTLGDQRTFLIKAKATQVPLIIQRVSTTKKMRKRGSGLSATRMLYTLVRRSKRPHRIDWEKTSYQTVQLRDAAIFAQVMRDALADVKRG